MHAVGIDIGGTKIAGALVDESGRIVREARVPTPETYGDDIIDAVVELVSELTEGAEAIGVGVAAAGFIDADQATIAYSPNIGWRNEPLKAKLEAKISLPVILENDANAAGWAEFKFGAGRGTKNMIMLTIGTGVGGAVIADSRLLRGGFGIGGELGHIRVVPDGLLCGCGAHGCIEQYGSGTALLKSARQLADAGTDEGATLRKLRDRPWSAQIAARTGPVARRDGCESHSSARPRNRRDRRRSERCRRSFARPHSQGLPRKPACKRLSPGVECESGRVCERCGCHWRRRFSALSSRAQVK
jgi:glucokinase-like ROK family protein